jgi:hypothetical protein
MMRYICTESQCSVARSLATESDDIAKEIARVFGMPMDVVQMTDSEFHWWLHHTDDGRRLLETT